VSNFLKIIIIIILLLLTIIFSVVGKDLHQSQNPTSQTIGFILVVLGTVLIFADLALILYLFADWWRGQPK
jgi:hypothetical protein